MSNKFGTHVKEVREKAGLLQREVAALLKMDGPFYSRIERGHRRTRKETVLLIAEVLNANREEMLTLWLADVIVSIVADEAVALPALLIAEEQVRYKSVPQE